MGAMYTTTSTALPQDGLHVTHQPSMLDVEPTSEVTETTYVGTNSALEPPNTSVSGSALRALDMSSTTTTKPVHTTTTVMNAISSMITIPSKPRGANSHSSLMSVTQTENSKTDSSGGNSSPCPTAITRITQEPSASTVNFTTLILLITPYISYNVKAATSSSSDPTVEYITSMKDSSTDSNSHLQDQLLTIPLDAHGQPAKDSAQACVTMISTWEPRTVNSVTTPAPTDAVTVTHVPTMLATLTVPHVAAQDLTNVPHVTAMPISLMVAAHVMPDISEVPTTVNSQPATLTAVTSASRTKTNTHVFCAKTTSSTSKTKTKDSDIVSTVMMMTSTHIQPVEDVNATKS